MYLSVLSITSEQGLFDLFNYFLGVQCKRSLAFSEKKQESFMKKDLKIERRFLDLIFSLVSNC